VLLVFVLGGVNFYIHYLLQILKTVLFGSYSAGVGYISGHTGAGEQIRVWLDPGSFECTSMDLIWSFQNLNGNDAGVIRGFSGVEGGSTLMSNSAVFGDGSSHTDAISTASPPNTIQSILIGTDAHSASGKSPV